MPAITPIVMPAAALTLVTVFIFSIVMLICISMA
jgi:hypothetical protein